MLQPPGLFFLDGRRNSGATVCPIPVLLVGGPKAPEREFPVTPSSRRHGLTGPSQRKPLMGGDVVLDFARRSRTAKKWVVNVP